MSAPTPVAATLRAARARIADPAAWCQGEYAIDAAGYSIPPRDPDAVCCCAAGAVETVVPAEDWIYLDTVIRALAHAIDPDALLVAPENIVTCWNDDPATTHADVLALFDRAIAAAEETQL